MKNVTSKSILIGNGININFGGKAYTNNYRLVIANEIDVEEIEFHIDIAFADDFGFDL